MEKETILEQDADLTQLQTDATFLEKDLPALPGWKTVRPRGLPATII